MTTALGTLLRRRIALAGPITVADFMLEALAHPTMGYYRRSPAVGGSGDFVTAPEISQMFGELIGAWLAERWIQIGRPAAVRLIELGPGRGTLLMDVLRATRGVPDFHAALRLHLVEIDGTLQQQQRAALQSIALETRWHERFDDVPDDAPMLLVANEFFDALPVRQLVHTAVGWRERMIGLAPAAAPAESGDVGRFVFALAPGPSPLAAMLEPTLREAAPGGAVGEVSPAALSLVHLIARRMVRHRGAAVIVDYGYDRGSHGDTLQAMHRHAKVDVFHRIGQTDLTAHVDFAALARAARQAGAATDGPVGQGDFLQALGIATRAEALLARASPAQAASIRAATARLIGPNGMGTLFRVLGLRDPATAPAPGFASADSADTTNTNPRPQP